jgi:hypothetical protein
MTALFAVEEERAGLTGSKFPAARYGECARFWIQSIEMA